jgi:hypothetical protein
VVAPSQVMGQKKVDRITVLKSHKIPGEPGAVTAYRWRARLCAKPRWKNAGQVEASALGFVSGQRIQLIQPERLSLGPAHI